jgi:two-component system NtrC family sensor kinase
MTTNEQAEPARSVAIAGDLTADASRDLLRTESAAIGRLAAGAAYELEAPLSRVLVNLRAVADALLADEEIDVERIRDALDAADRMRSTVRGLSAFTTLDDDPHGVDVHEALELAAHLAGHEINARARLRRHYSALARVRGNVGRLTQVFLSLFRNAAASIPASLPAANSIWVHTGLALDGRVTIDILDTGEGIEPDDLPFVFDPFFTTKPTSASPGLGLAAARAALLELGGTITVESTVGRGSWFRVTLPPLGDAEAPTLPLFASEDVAPKRLLCVAENDAEVRRLGELVDHDGAQVVFATIDDALVRLSLGEAYDLVVCEARAASRASFRERVSRLAPEALGRTFLLTLRSSPSGTFLKPSARIARGVPEEKRRTGESR